MLSFVKFLCLTNDATFYMHFFLPSSPFLTWLTAISQYTLPLQEDFIYLQQSPGLPWYLYLRPQHHAHCVIIELTTMADKSLYRAVYPK